MCIMEKEQNKKYISEVFNHKTYFCPNPVVFPVFCKNMHLRKQLTFVRPHFYFHVISCRFDLCRFYSESRADSDRIRIKNSDSDATSVSKIIC